MAENLSNIYYLSAEQWTEMVTYGYITVDGTRYDYNVNNIYYVKEELQIPNVSTSDNGKVLQVVDGAWTTGTNITDLSSSLTSVTNRVTTAETNITSLSTTVASKADLVDGKVPSSQLPGYVDDVVEGYYYDGQFYSDSEHTQVITPETGKIYVDLTTNKTFRWSGSTYVEISASLTLGETESTAYRGDRGKTAYDHSQLTSGNPHGVTYTDVGITPNTTETTTTCLNSIKVGTTSYKIDALPAVTTADVGKTVCVDTDGTWKPSHLAVTHTYATDITGDGTTTNFTITHNLNSYDVLIQVYNISNKATIVTETTRPTLNTVNIEFAEAPASESQYRVLVFGMSVSIISQAES